MYMKNQRLISQDYDQNFVKLLDILSEISTHQLYIHLLMGRGRGEERGGGWRIENFRKKK